ncbi:MAG TPA: DUF4251 domain-containing protein [Bacteroidales bacterium]|nr:DUF4251 domain-containing protein [Bacteroidales bacterium]
MKNIVSLLTILICATGFGTSAFAVKPLHNTSVYDNHKKMVRDSTLQLKFEQTKQMLEGRDFVLEADYLANKFGERMPVTSSLNFISVKDSTSVLQIGRNTGIGYNGVGGVTTEGTISRYKLNTDQKKKNFFLSFSVMSPLGSFDINMSVGADGYARATLTGITGGQLTYTGYLVTTENSSVYKGYNTY